MKGSLVAVLLFVMCLVPLTAETQIFTSTYTTQAFEPITFHYLGLDYITLNSDTFGLYARFNLNSALAVSNDQSLVFAWQQNNSFENGSSRAVNPGLSHVLGAGADIDLGFIKIILGGGPVIDIKEFRFVPADDIEFLTGNSFSNPGRKYSYYILYLPISVGLSGGANVVFASSSKPALTLGAYATWLPLGAHIGGPPFEVVMFQDWNSVEVAFNAGIAW